MDKRVDLDALTRKTRRLEFEDGLNDLQNGLIFLILGLLGSLFMSTAGIKFYMRGMLFNSEITTIALLALIPLMILITFGVRRIITRYRKRVLWQGLGDLEPLRWQVDRRISVLATAVWLVVVIVGLVVVAGDPSDLDADMRVMIAAGGIATGVIYFALGHSLELVRYRWLGLVGGLLSSGLMLIPINTSLSWLVFGFTWAVALSISGIIAFKNVRSRLQEGAV